MIKVMLNESKYFSSHYTEIFDLLYVRVGNPCLWYAGYWVGFRFLMCLCDLILMIKFLKTFHRLNNINK